MAELVYQEYRILPEYAVINPGIGDIQIESSSDAVKGSDKQNACFRYGVHAGIDEGKVEC
ncbi:MAG: hypothetical protein JW384_02047 [Nitrosomonadaceae bacterium]|nr:hypothetical protein [Nitrosomonadaceae bacterium]